MIREPRNRQVAEQKKIFLGSKCAAVKPTSMTPACQNYLESLSSMRQCSDCQEPAVHFLCVSCWGQSYCCLDCTRKASNDLDSDATYLDSDDETHGTDGQHTGPYSPGPEDGYGTRDPGTHDEDSEDLNADFEEEFEKFKALAEAPDNSNATAATAGSASSASVIAASAGSSATAAPAATAAVTVIAATARATESVIAASVGSDATAAPANEIAVTAGTAAISATASELSNVEGQPSPPNLGCCVPGCKRDFYDPCTRCERDAKGEYPCYCFEHQYHIEHVVLMSPKVTATAASAVTASATVATATTASATAASAKSAVNATTSSIAVVTAVDDATSASVERPNASEFGMSNVESDVAKDVTEANVEGQPSPPNLGCCVPGCKRDFYDPCTRCERDAKGEYPCYCVEHQYHIEHVVLMSSKTTASILKPNPRCSAPDCTQYQSDACRDCERGDDGEFPSFCAVHLNHQEHVLIVSKADKKADNGISKIPKIHLIKTRGHYDNIPFEIEINGEVRTLFLHIFNTGLIKGGYPPNQFQYYNEVRLPTAVVGDTIEEINARLQQARSHAREVVRSESSSAFAATDPPQFIQNNFKLFGYVVYAAVTKFRRTFFSRCALYDAGTKSVDFILMRVLSTCCDNPNRAWYVYHIKTETFKIVDDTFVHENMYSDTNFRYNDLWLEIQFFYWCDCHGRQIYLISRGIKRVCNGRNAMALQNVEEIYLLQPGEVDVSDKMWDSVTGPQDVLN